MPICGVTDRVVVPVQSKVRIGELVDCGGGRTRPQKLDHFIPGEGESDEDKLLWREIYGDTVRRLRLVLVGQDLNRCFPHFLKLYSRTAGLLCKGDSERVIWQAEDVSKEMTENGICDGPQACQLSMAKGKDGRPGCGPKGSLRFMLADWPDGRVWRFDTGSWHSIRAIVGGVSLIERLHGTVEGVEADLQVVRESVKKDGQTQTLFVVRLVPAAVVRVGGGQAAARAAAGRLAEDTTVDGEDDGEDWEEGTTEDTEVHREEEEKAKVVDWREEAYQRMAAARLAAKWPKERVRDVCMREFSVAPDQLGQEQFERLIGMVQAGVEAARDGAKGR